MCLRNGSGHSNISVKNAIKEHVIGGTPTGMPEIFISYRREDAEHAAGRLLKRFERDSSHDIPFMNVDKLKVGSDFARELNRQLHNEVLLRALGYDDTAPRRMTTHVPIDGDPPKVS
jgi:hypothetical protein